MMGPFGPRPKGIEAYFSEDCTVRVRDHAILVMVWQIDEQTYLDRRRRLAKR